MPRAYITYRSSGYGYECHTELPGVPVREATEHNLAQSEVPGMGTDFEVFQVSQKLRVRYGRLTELTEAPDRHANVEPVPVPATVFCFQGLTRTPGIVLF